MNKLSIIVLLGFFAVSGCSSAPSLGDKMGLTGTNANELGEQWNEGHEMVLDAAELKQEGYEEIKSGNKKVAKANEMSLEGKQIMSESEAKFGEMFPGQSLNKQ
ncbi:MAG: hypothetical protein V4629_08730 [Pseudomonadota bacterium]